MKIKKKCHTTGTVLKFNRKIVERGKIYPPNTHIHGRTLPWLVTGISLLENKLQGCTRRIREEILSIFMWLRFLL